MKKTLYILIMACLCGLPAVGQVKSALELDNTTYNYAIDLYHAGNYDQALKEMTLLTPKTEEEKTQHYNLKGAIYFQKKDWEKAIQYFEVALATGRDAMFIQHNLGEVYFALQKYEKAVPYYRKARTKNVSSRFKLYLCHLLSGDETAAERELKNIEPTSGNPAFYYAHAAKNYEGGDFEKASYFITSAQAIYPAAKRSFYEKTITELGWLLPQAIY